MRSHSVPPAAHRGFVFVTSLLLLVVVTILAVSMFRSFGIQEKIAGNMREKQRALHAAESAQQYAEWWLTSADNVDQVFNCTGVMNAGPTVGQICSNPLPSTNDPAVVPWKIGGAEVGVNYTPPSMRMASAADVGTYVATPRFYISLMGPSATGQGNIYQIDAVGYGGTANAVAVVESTYLVNVGVKDLGAL